MSTTTGRQQIHSTFSLERTYDAPVAKVFHALSDKDAMGAWFGSPDTLEVDFRVGGGTVNSGEFEGGTVHTFKSTYHDIIPDERIVYSYDMWLNDNHISVSITTITFEPDGDGTHLTFTEQGVFLDGYDDAGSREHGTNELLDELGKAVSK